MHKTIPIIKQAGKIRNKDDAFKQLETLFITRPSDLGYSDEGYDLPQMNIVYHPIESDHATAGSGRNGQYSMFRDSALGLKQAAREKRDSLEARIAKAKTIIDADPDSSYILSCYLSEYRQATDEQIMKSMRGEIIVRIGILKNIAARGKLNDVAAYIDNIIEQGEKIVVFIYLKEIADRLREHYPGALFFTGEQNEEERNRAIDDFQKCEECGVRLERHQEAGHEFVPSTHNIIFVNYKAGGTGITLTASSTVLFIELPWHPADVEQAESRCHRISQKNAVQASFFLGQNTIDEAVMQIIEDKREMSEACTGATDSAEERIIHSIIELLAHA